MHDRIHARLKQTAFTNQHDGLNTSPIDMDVEELAEVCDVTAIGDALMSLCLVQQHVSGRVDGALDGSRESLAIYLHALCEEVHEVGRAAQWQPWRDDRGPKTDEIVKEMSDVLAFLGVVLKNLAKRTGVPESTLVSAIAVKYFDTSVENVRRLSHHEK